MRILIGNDDGIASPGLGVLRRIAEKLTNDVWVVAPSRKWTAASHQLSFDQDLELTPHGDRVWSCSGAPADCVVAAMGILFSGRRTAWPDLVLSGINDGLNVGEDAIYSGTLAYVREATLWGIPAIGFSEPKNRVTRPNDVTHLAELIAGLWTKRDVWMGCHDRDQGAYYLSINLPINLPAKVIEARPGTDKIASEIERRGINTDGVISYRIVRSRPGTMVPGDQNSAVASGHIAIARFSPLGLSPLAPDDIRKITTPP